jgi:UPF0755 protein
MSNLDLFSSEPPQPPHKAPHRAAHGSKRKSLGKVVIFVVAIVAGIALMAPKVISMFSGPPDFPGPGSGSVQVQIAPGETLAQIGNSLKASGVVESVDGFIAAASANPDSALIAPGAYNLLSQMKSSDAILALLDSANRVVSKVVIPEGKRVTWTLETLATETGLPLSDFEAAIAKADGLGLPEYAAGNAEGFLFPATYEFAPGTSAEQMIAEMIARFNAEAKAIDLEARAEQMGRSAYEIMIVASLLEVEGHPRDFKKVARVVYNRLAEPMPLQFDSSVNYGLGKTDVILTTELLNQDTAYNVYLRPGLPPTPIDSPGTQAIEAALAPEAGDWLFFITVDLNTKETKFTRSYSEFLEWKDEFLTFCEANAGVCY